MSSEIIKVLDALCEKFGIVIDWTNNNVLPYVEQLCQKFIVWEISTSLAWIGIALFSTVIMLILAIIIYKTGDWEGMEWVCFMFVLIVTVLICGTQIFDIIECKTFPEKTIYDYIKTYSNMR